MNWVDFKGVTFNLDNVTHFEIDGDLLETQELRANLNIGYPEIKGIEKAHQAYIIIATGTSEQCLKWITEIAAGKHSLPCPYLYSIQKDLKMINETLAKIAGSIERFSQQ